MNRREDLQRPGGPRRENQLKRNPKKEQSNRGKGQGGPVPKERYAVKNVR